MRKSTEVAVLGSLSLTVLVVSVPVRSVDITEATLNETESELRSCVKVEVAVLGSPSLIVLMVSVDA